MQTIEALRDTFRSAREARGISRAVLARIATVRAQTSDRCASPVTVDDVRYVELRCRVIPDPTILRPMAEALEVDLFDVFRKLGF